MLKIDINLVFTIINLLLLFVAMRIFFFKPIKKVIEERQKEADKQFEEAKAKQEEADGLKTQYEATLADAEALRKDTIAKARKEADAEYEKILKEAEDDAKKVRHNAEVDAENKKAQILKSAESEITTMVADAARKIVDGSCNAETDSALYDKFLKKAGEDQ